MGLGSFSKALADLGSLCSKLVFLVVLRALNNVQLSVKGGKLNVPPHLSTCWNFSIFIFCSPQGSLDLNVTTYVVPFHTMVSTFCFCESGRSKINNHLTWNEINKRKRLEANKILHRVPS